MIILYGILLLGLSVYSYALLDPNITFFNFKLWADFREVMVQLGYYNRPLSWGIYLFMILGLFFFHIYFYKIKPYKNPILLACLIGGILLMSYPFLSHDFFNYMFDAKIYTFYHQNPYLHRAMDFPADPWLRFMHWVHRTYPYGPVFLVLSFIPSFFGFGKFILAFFFFKTMFLIFYITTVYLLNKFNRNAALFFATNPFVLIEGLVSSHNDFIAVSLAIIGIYFVLSKKNTILSTIFLLLSAGIKYVTLPYVFLSRQDLKYARYITFIGIIIILAYLSFKMEIQQWYFLNITVLSPLYEKLIFDMNIFFGGLLLSYYPFIMLGGWDSKEKLIIKHVIILVFFIMNIVYLLLLYANTLFVKTAQKPALVYTHGKNQKSRKKNT